MIARRHDALRAPSVNGVWTFPVRPDDGALLGLPPEVFFSGTLADAARLCADLGLPSGASAVNIIEVLYARQGPAGFARLRGSFALAVMDHDRGECIVGRDHVGLHPVFYAQHGQWVSVGASAQALAQLPGVSPKLNRAALADALCSRYPDHEETFFASVRRLPGGCVLRIARGRLLVERYWDPVGTREETDDRAYLDRFAAVQEQAVRRTMTDQNVGIFLSGGLDSVSIAAIAVDLAGTRETARPVALSLGLPHDTCDERPVQIAAASALGMRQHMLDFDDAVGVTPLLEQAIAMSSRLSSPLFNLWTTPYLALARVGARDGVTTVITGVGGDEWLSTSGYATADYLWRGRFDKAATFVREWNRSEDGAGLLWNYGLRPVMGRAIAKIAPLAWHRRRSLRMSDGDPDWIAPDRALRATQRARAEGALGVADPAEGFAGADANLILRHVGTSHMFEEYFETGPLAGVRFVHPYYDPDLVQFACDASPAELNHGGWLRGLLRTQLADRLPALGFDRQRKVLATDFHRRSLSASPTASAFIKDGFSALSDLGVVDSAKVRAALDADLSARANSARLDLVNLEAWVRSHA